MRTVIVGASPKPERYANKAQQMLVVNDHEVVGVRPGITEIEGMLCVPGLKNVTGIVDTVTMYISASRSSSMIDDLLELKSRRVIFNPGSENPVLEAALREAGILVDHACTLVLLNTKQY
jgi:predicted CoA-binding protein